MKSQIANAVQEQVFEFESLMTDLKQQKTAVSLVHQIASFSPIGQFSRTKTSEDKKYAKERLKELLPRQPKPAKQPWHDSTNHNYELEKDIKRLPTCQLTNNQLYRVHLLPRSYD